MSYAPTPEAIEAAAEAFALAEGRIAFSRLSKADQKYYRELMTAALTAAAPFDAAQVKGEALREAADAFDYEAWNVTYTAMQGDPDANVDRVGVPIEWLRARAATIESEAS